MTDRRSAQVHLQRSILGRVLTYPALSSLTSPKYLRPHLAERFNDEQCGSKKFGGVHSQKVPRKRDRPPTRDYRSMQGFSTTPTDQSNISQKSAASICTGIKTNQDAYDFSASVLEKMHTLNQESTSVLVAMPCTIHV